MSDKLISQYEEGIPGDNDLILYEQSSSPGSYKFARKSNVGTGSGGGGGATTLSAPPSFNITITGSTTATANWGAVSNESGFQLQQSPAGAGTWTTIATPAANATSQSITGLSPSTTYDWRIKSVGDGVTYLDSSYSTDTDTTSSAGPSLQDLTFTAANVGLSQTGNVWTGSLVAADFENKGLDAKKIAAGTDGYIVCQYKADALGCVFGFNLTNANDDYPQYECAMYLTAANIYTVSNGALGSYGAPTVDRYYRISRTGSTIKLQWATSDAPGATWTDIIAYATTTTADLFICIAIDEKNGDGKCYYPKVYNGV